MLIEWDDEQRALLDGLTGWCAALSADHIVRDAEGAFPRDSWKLLAECGLFRLPFDEAHGGLGRDLLTTMYLLEGLGHGCRDSGLSFSAVTHMVSVGVPLQRFGSPHLRERYLPLVCGGDAIGAHAITESGSGSDALAMRTTAVATNAGYLLNGSKAFVSNGPVADVFVVYARTHEDRGPLGITAFLVERDRAGLTLGPPTSKMGLRTSPLGELHLDDCLVPAAHVIGRPGGGFLVLDHVMKWEILCSFIVKIGEMQHRLEKCVAYARSRSQFGSPIGRFQAISHKMVDMRIAIESGRSWLYRTAAKMQAGGNVTCDVAMAKLMVSEANVASALAAVQIFGGSGYLTELGMEKDLRDAVGGTIYSGTSEIQRNRIAAIMGL